jgi:hypothetical protein
MHALLSVEDTSDLLIPAVFVSRSSYLVIQDELTLSSLPSPGGIEIRLYEDLGWEWPLLDLLLLLLLLPSLLTLATLTVHHFRLVQYVIHRVRRLLLSTNLLTRSLSVETASVTWTELLPPSSTRFKPEFGRRRDGRKMSPLLRRRITSLRCRERRRRCWAERGEMRRSSCRRSSLERSRRRELPSPLDRNHRHDPGEQPRMDRRTQRDQLRDLSRRR